MKNGKTIWAVDNVIDRKVDDLIPYARNARQHSNTQIASLAASIKEFGFTIPVLIDEHNNLLAGHGRVIAAKQIGINKVPALIATGWSESKKKAYIIADNRLAETSTWDNILLQEELGELVDEGEIDLASLGFEIADLEEIGQGAYAPELTPVTGSYAVTDEDVFKADASLAGAPKSRSEQTLVKVICPHCAKEFAVDPKTIT